MTEKFQCPRCGYRRVLRAGEDGFRLYLVHEKRCRPQPGQQLWLPMVTEDDLRWEEIGATEVEYAGSRQSAMGGLYA